MANERVGFIGTGIMGEPMAANLLKAGFRVTVHSRTKSKVEKLLAAGAVWADSPSEAAINNDVIITCVTDTPDVREVLLGGNGVIKSAKKGLICIDMSTISPAATREMAKVLAAKGVALIDAPVSGGQIGAIEAKLSIMAGGSKDTFEKVKHILSAMGRTVTYCGQSGCGQMTKLVNQVMAIHTLMSMAEGLAFAEKAGLDLKTTWDVTTAGAAGSQALKVLGAKVLAGDFKPAFMVDLLLKDLRLVMEMADEIQQPLPGTALAKELLSVLKAQGRGRDGTQALVDVIRQLGK